MSLDEIVSIISHDYDKSFDHAFKEKIKLEVINKRALLIRRDLDKGRKIDSSLINVMSNVEMVSSEIPDWYKTKCPIPKPIRLSEGNTLFSVGSSLLETYDMIKPMEVEFLSYSKWGNVDCARPKAFYVNGHVYANSNEPLTLQMIASNPTQFSEFIEGCSQSTVCDFEPDVFVTDDMVDPIKRLISETMPRINPRDFEVKPNEQS